MAENTFSSEVFRDQVQQVNLAGDIESVLYGGDRPFDQVAEALSDVAQLAVVGWSSQGPAQAQNLRESLAAVGSDTRVVVGLRPGSESRPGAEAAGFDLASGTLMTSEEALRTSNMSLMLIGDADMARDGQELVGYMPEGSTLGLSHGFWLGYLEGRGERVRDDISLVGVCPKGMGPSVRGLYQQGSGINTSYALTQGDDAARERALAWAVGIGAPYTFQTTLEKEWRSDIFGERAILLGGVHGIVEALYSWMRQHGAGAEEAYLQSVDSLVGPISKTISKEGLVGVFEKLSESDREKFAEAYNAAYPVLSGVIEDIYDSVSAGIEIDQVIEANEKKTPMTEVDGSDMWLAGARVRAARGIERLEAVSIDPTVAGVYIAGMMAQVDVLRANDHNWSEVVNESIIEAVDSLNPYMAARGVANMVDNCSVTARRGSRKWAPVFESEITQQIMPVIDGSAAPQDRTDHFTNFLNHDVHGVLQKLGELRPPIDIAVS